MEATVEIGEHTYRLGKLDTMTQLHVSRRLAPLLTELIPMFRQMRETAKVASQTGEAFDVETAKEMPVGILNVPLPQLSSLAGMLANLSDEAVNYIIGKCLSVVARRAAGDAGWSPVWNTSAGIPQFSDIQLPAMLSLTMSVVLHNMQGFIGAASTLGQAGAAPPPKQ